MEKRTPWCHGLTPFMNNLDPRTKDPMYKEIKENGLQATISLDTVKVDVTSGSELSPEAQEEILSEEF